MGHLSRSPLTTGSSPKNNPLRSVGAIVRAALIIFGTCLILLTGCGAPASPTPGAILRAETALLPTGAPTSEPSPISTRVLPLEVFTPEPTPTITPIPDEARGLVVEVIDGDTIAVVLEGDSPSQAYVVRYIGVDAPPNTPNDPWGVVAYETNRRMVNLKIARLVADEENFDEEGRLLRYVFVGDEMMSIILAERGLAQADITAPNTRFQAEIEEAEARARNGQLGLWGPPPTPTAPSRRATTAEEDVEETESTPTVEATTSSPTGTTTTEAEDSEETPTASATTEETEATNTPTPTEESSADTETTPETTAEAGNESTEGDGLQGPQ